MPRKCSFTQDQETFMINNAHKGAIWLAEELQVDRAWIYQWGTDNKISVKKRDYPVKQSNANLINGQEDTTDISSCW